MITPEVRAQRMTDLRRQGVSLPYLSPEDLASDWPPRSMRETLWLSHLYDRPTQRMAEDHPFELASVQESWDKSKPFVEGANERKADREAAAKAEQDARAQVDADQRASDAERVKAELRNRYLSLPGTSETEFDHEYPQQLADHRRRELERAEREGEQAHKAMADLVRANL